MGESPPIREGQILIGSLFSEPMPVETVGANSPGSSAAEKIFTKRIPQPVDFQIGNLEFALYRDVMRFILV